MPDEELLTDETSETPAVETTVAAETPSITDLQASIARMEKALKEANKEAEQRRKKLAQYEQAEQQRQQADLSETDKLRQELAQYKQQHEQATAELMTRRILDATQREAAKLNLAFHDGALEDAQRLGELDEITISETGNIVKVADVLKELAKRKPWLLKTATAVPHINATERGTTTKAAEDARTLEQNSVRWGIRTE